MSLTDHEQSQLVATDRALSGDPVLRAVAELFPFPPSAARAIRAVTRWSAHRLLLVMVWSLAAVAVGLVITILTTALASPAVAAGLAVMIAAATAFAVAAIRRGAVVSESLPVAVGR